MSEAIVGRRAELFKALSVETLVKIAELPKQGPLGVSEIAETLGVTPLAASQHAINRVGRPLRHPVRRARRRRLADRPAELPRDLADLPDGRTVPCSDQPGAVSVVCVRDAGSGAAAATAMAGAAFVTRLMSVKQSSEPEAVRCGFTASAPSGSARNTPSTSLSSNRHAYRDSPRTRQVS
jgi:hypothetical protein